MEGTWLFLEAAYGMPVVGSHRELETAAFFSLSASRNEKALYRQVLPRVGALDAAVNIEIQAFYLTPEANEPGINRQGEKHT